MIISNVFFPDDLNESGEYYFNSGFFNKYCPNKNCDGDIKKIMTWLGYKLNQKLNREFSNINEFYNKHMKNIDGYNNYIENFTKYTSYIDLINKKQELMDISNENVSKLYDLLKILCIMINSADKKDDGKT
ncbi:Plasmodium variant antigen protein Cir/Yir/Bir, putative [Plasmodium berghei]|uniref:Plasmodium variant antigen protein Cir/Yir/Bir, putative n=1 Tax=Plasmodium berghei TaxID=5821 RepID=A0A1D3L6G1_PLABE|nr:Plasmodium variant antigen protein Cir/Yir/Bir, putative [Plasmodium berghei]